MIEIWDPETYEFPSEYNDTKKRLSYELVTDTDLMELAKNKTYALSTAISN